MKRLLLLPFFFFAFSGCDPVSDETGCSDDSDCRFGRQCVQNICVGEVDLADTNNGQSNNGNSNNGDPEPTNNDENPCIDECGGREYVGLNFGIGSLNCICNNDGGSTNNLTTPQCEGVDECPPDSVCSLGLCTAPAMTTLLNSEVTSDGCKYTWNDNHDGQRFITYSCERSGNSEFDCKCSVESTGRTVRNDFQSSQNACDDYSQIEQDMNTYCGTKIRDTFSP